MNFEDLQERLRAELVRRVERGVLTGTALARQAGFKQGHISNFLSGKRPLSLGGLDRVLAAQGLSVADMLPLDLSAAAEAEGGSGEAVEEVPVVTPSTAMTVAAVRPEQVIETVRVAAAALSGNRWWTQEKYRQWQRYVAVRADAQQAAAMDPLVVPGAVVVLDRHYHSLAPYHAYRKTLYAVRAGGGLVLRYVEFDGGTLVLRPLAGHVPVQLITPAEGETPSDYIVGRVCVLVSEL